MAAMDSPDETVATMASGLRWRSTFSNMARLVSRSSATASKIRSASATARARSSS